MAWADKLMHKHRHGMASRRNVNGKGYRLVRYHPGEDKRKAASTLLTERSTCLI